MKRYLPACVGLSLILALALRWMPYRLTAMGAIQAGMRVKAQLLLAERFQGGQAVLVERSDGGHELFMISQVGPFYRVESSATLQPPLNGDRLSSTANVMPTGSNAQVAVAFGGMVTDDEVVRITAGGSQQSVQHQRYYLFTWVTADRNVWHDARAYNAAGAVRYELQGLQWKAVP